MTSTSRHVNQPKLHHIYTYNFELNNSHLFWFFLWSRNNGTIQLVSTIFYSLILNYGLVSFSSLSVSVVPENKQSHADHGTPWHTMAHQHHGRAHQGMAQHTGWYEELRIHFRPFFVHCCCISLWSLCWVLNSIEMVHLVFSMSENGLSVLKLKNSPVCASPQS